MTRTEIYAPLTRLKKQLSRFGLVGVSNTAIDFLITNILFLVFLPSSPLSLFTISAVAGASAACNSYYLNSRWTFQSNNTSKQTIPKFAMVSALGLVVNSAIFMSIVTSLPEKLPGLFSHDIYLINVAKLCSVLLAMLVTFLGYRLWVFNSQDHEQLRQENPSLTGNADTQWKPMCILVLLALLIRLVYLYFTPVVYGDAANYAWDAWGIGTGNPQSIDVFWHSLFDFWQALWVALGLSSYHALVISTLIPGVLLIIPVYRITQRLYGHQAAQVAALFTALQPRLIEYASNGYAESFFLLFLLWAVYELICLQQQSKGNHTLAIGLGLAVYFLCRNEGIIFIAGIFALWLYFAYKESLPAWTSIAQVSLIIALITLAYTQINHALWDQYGLFSKATNLAKETSEGVDLAAVVKSSSTVSSVQAFDPIHTITLMFQRWPENIQLLMIKLPGVLFSPLFIFALLLPWTNKKRPVNRYESWPLHTFIAFPVLFYPFIQLEPRMLFPIAIGVNIFGAAGLIAFAHILQLKLNSQKLLGLSIQKTLITGIAVFFIASSALLSWSTEQKQAYHRVVGAWVKEHIPQTASIYGNGFGYISNTGFWADRPDVQRYPWAESDTELSQRLQQQTHGKESYLILYEEMLQRSNPSLLSVLDIQPKGLSLIKTFQSPASGRIAVFRIKAQ